MCMSDANKINNKKKQSHFCCLAQWSSPSMIGMLKMSSTNQCFRGLSLCPIHIAITVVEMWTTCWANPMRPAFQCLWKTWEWSSTFIRFHSVIRWKVRMRWEDEHTVGKKNNAIHHSCIHILYWCLLSVYFYKYLYFCTVIMFS